MTVSDQIIAVLNDLCQKFGIVIDWSQENVIPYLTELAGRYINYEIATSIAWIIIAVIGTTLICLAIRYASKSDDIDVWFPAVIFGIMGLGVLIICCITQVFDIIECLTLPEKTIIEYLTVLMRKM